MAWGPDARRWVCGTRLRVSYDGADATRDAITQAVDARFQHIILGLPAPYPEHVGRWITSELINAST